MAKIIGPLHSQTAAGSIGNLLTFQSHHGAQIAKAWRAPIYTPTPSQRQRREKWHQGANAWHANSTAERAAWDAIGEKTGLSAWAAFIAAYMLATPQTGGASWDAGATTWDNNQSAWDGTGNGTPTPPSTTTATQWDAGAATWDNGAAHWQN
jgi:hypothetical protein